MKILFFSRDYTNHDHRWLQTLANAGHVVRFLRLERAGSNHDQRPLPNGVSEVDWSGGKAAFSWDRADELQGELAEILDRETPDILHAGPLNTASVLAARANFHPLVQMSWGSDILRFAQEDEQEAKYVSESLKAADVLIGDCDAVRKTAIEMGMSNEDIVTFPWGIDIRRFSPGEDEDLRAKLSWQENFVILHTRGLGQDYGVEAIAAGFAQAARQDESLRLILAGGGALKETLESYFAERALSDRVYFGGQTPQTEQPNYFRAADLYVSGTFSDGSSVSLMEALASGLPVLVSDIPGNREWVLPGREGWLFSAGESGALAEHMLRIAKLSKSELSAIGQVSRRKAEQKADWAVNQLGIEKAYAIAIGESEGARA